MQAANLNWYRMPLVVLLLAVPAGANAAEPARDKPRSRTFRFTYAATVTGLQKGEKAHIWVPVPPTNGQQEVELVSRLLPSPGKVGRDATYGNQILYFEGRANAKGEIPFRLTYRVTRHEVRTDGKEGVAQKEADKHLQRLLQPDLRVPLTGKPLDLLKGKKVPADETEAARFFYDLVNKHMVYAKDTPGWGQGDAVFACTAGRGNCSDFHSLFISLARANKIPARFEIGFPLPEKHGEGEIPGYHCWAWFRPDGKGWVPVDISEANKNPALTNYYFGNLTENRVTFSTGRDLELVPKQDGPPLNFFVYPYVEVKGKPYPQAKIRAQFSFKDLPADRPEK